MKKLYAMTALSALLMTGSAMADDAVTTKAQSSYQPSENGGYEAKDSTEHTDAAGTTAVQSSDKKVSVDSKGNKKTTVDIKNSTDPKGLMNKSTTKVHNKAVQNVDGTTEYSHTKTVNGKAVEDSDDKTNNQ